MEDVCDMQKMTSIVQIIARKRDSNWEALAMDKAVLLVLVEQDKMVKHFTHFGKKIKKVWTTVYRLNSYKNSKNTTQWMISILLFEEYLLDCINIPLYPELAKKQEKTKTEWQSFKESRFLLFFN